MASDLKLKINQTASLERALKFAAKFWRRRVRFQQRPRGPFYFYKLIASEVLNI